MATWDWTGNTNSAWDGANNWLLDGVPTASHPTGNLPGDIVRLGVVALSRTIATGPASPTIIAELDVIRLGYFNPPPAMHVMWANLTVATLVVEGHPQGNECTMTEGTVTGRLIVKGPPAFSIKGGVIGGTIEVFTDNSGPFLITDSTDEAGSIIFNNVTIKVYGRLHMDGSGYMMQGSAVVKPMRKSARITTTGWMPNLTIDPVDVQPMSRALSVG